MLLPPPQRPASQHDLLRAVDGLVAAGLTLDAVDRRLVPQLGLDHERRASLWLYASARAGGRRRGPVVPSVAG